jgi:cytochrome c biogenesis protein CcmG, thiol:disulfide interchange protein DsbE
MKRLVVVAAVVAALVGLFLFGLLRGRPDRNIESNILGKPVTDFELPLFERYQSSYGTTFKLSEHKGQPIVINFWASWCIPCYEEAPQLEVAWQRYQNQVLLVGIQTLDKGNKDKGRDFIEQFNLSFPNVIDESSNVNVDYGLVGVPETFFIKSDGTLMYKHIGPVNMAVLEEKIGELLQ